MQTLVPAHRTLAVLAACCMMPLFGCGESSPTEPGPPDASPAYLRIATSTDGLLIDADGYDVVVDGGSHDNEQLGPTTGVPGRNSCFQCGAASL